MYFFIVWLIGFCNLRLIEFQKKSHEFSKNFIHWYFSLSYRKFKTSNDKHKELKFKILFDEDFKYFEKYEVERSHKLIMTLVFKSYKAFPAIIKGFVPMPIKGHLDIAITDILINEKGIVEEVYYAKKHSADHFDFEKIKQFSQ